jgi:hypothetical protein
MPLAGANDHVVQVEAIGAFTFARRTMRLQQALNVELRRRDGGVELDQEAQIVNIALATLAVLTVDAPEGWDPDNADPFDPDVIPNIIAVWGALRLAEESFRAKPQAPA